MPHHTPPVPKTLPTPGSRTWAQRLGPDDADFFAQEDGLKVPPLAGDEPASAGLETPAPRVMDLADPYEVWRRAKTPDNMVHVVHHLQPTIGQAIQHYGIGTSPILHDRARLMAARAVKSFDPSKGADLKTHVFRQLQELQRLAPQVSAPLSAPERLQRQQAELWRATEQARNELGRDVTDEEIARRLEWPVKQVLKVRGLSRYQTSQSHLEDTDAEDEGQAPDAVQQGAVTPEQEWLDAVYHDLEPVDQLILRHRTGYRGHAVLDGPALQRATGLSVQQLSRRAAAIQQRLQQFHEKTPA